MTNRLRKQQTGFTQVPNALLLDRRLSLKAKGLYGLLFSKPDDWIYIEEPLIRESKDGRDSFRAGVAELLATGWLVKRQVQDQSGKFSHTDWVLTVDGFSGDGSAVDGESAPTNTNKTNTDGDNPSVSPRTKAPSRANSGQRLEAYLEQLGAEGLDNFGVPAEFGWWALNYGWDDFRINSVWESFRDYWLATPGQRGVKADWFATWRNWCRREANNSRGGRGTGGTAGGGLAAAVSAVVAARHGGSPSGSPQRGPEAAGDARPVDQRPREADGSLAVPF